MKRLPFYPAQFLAAVCAVLVLCPVAAAQDFEGKLEYQEYETTSDGKSKSDVSTNVMYLKPGMMRMDEPEENTSTIIRMDSEMLLHIDHDKKTYMEVSFAEIKEGLTRAKKAMEEAMKNLTPQQRQMMEKMGMKMPQLPAQKTYDLEKTEERKEISGYACEKYVLHKGEDESTDTWWITRDLGSFKHFGEMMAKVFEGFGMGQVAEAEKFAEIDGVPVKTVEQQGDKLRVSELTKVEKSTLDAAQFTAPEGYKKKEMPKMQFGK